MADGPDGADRHREIIQVTHTQHLVLLELIVRVPAPRFY